jgi:hypothetical protein
LNADQILRREIWITHKLQIYPKQKAMFCLIERVYLSMLTLVCLFGDTGVDEREPHPPFLCIASKSPHLLSPFLNPRKTGERYLFIQQKTSINDGYNYDGEIY